MAENVYDIFKDMPDDKFGNLVESLRWLLERAKNLHVVLTDEMAADAYLGKSISENVKALQSLSIVDIINLERDMNANITREAKIQTVIDTFRILSTLGSLA